MDTIEDVKIGVDSREIDGVGKISELDETDDRRRDDKGRDDKIEKDFVSCSVVERCDKEKDVIRYEGVNASAVESSDEVIREEGMGLEKVNEDKILWGKGVSFSVPERGEVGVGVNSSECINRTEEVGCLLEEGDGNMATV